MTYSKETLEEEIIQELCKISPRVEVYNPKQKDFPYYIKVKGYGTSSGNTKLNALLNMVYKINRKRNGS